jgi:L-fuculose-phosphate aldolase
MFESQFVRWGYNQFEVLSTERILNSMDFNLLHPRDQIVAIMRRIYDRDMTTLSGGNLSIRDEEGTIWITPAGVDKGNLTPQDIIKVPPEGEPSGPHRPSSELPFHRAIYAARPDLRAVVHAHAPALVTFSIAGQIPNTAILPQAAEVCGPIQYAPYAMTGSEALGINIANTFASGVNVVMLENHGVATGGSTLLEAFMRLETLEYCARTIILARGVGVCLPLQKEQIARFGQRAEKLDTFVPAQRSPLEQERRQQMVATVHRAYDRRLMTSTEGVVSARVDDDRFLITPQGVDRRQLEAEDIVLIEGERREQGGKPSREVALHREIYHRHPEVGSILTAQSPESYVFLREVPKLAFELLLEDPAQLAKAITDRSPVLLIQNFGALVTGPNLLQTYDRLEILEFTARSLLQLPPVGPLKPIGEDDLRAIEEKFFGA